MDTRQRVPLLWFQFLLVWCSIHSSQTTRYSCSSPNKRCVHNLSFLAFSSCIHPGNGSHDCDLFVYPAMLQAAEDINANGTILRNGKLEQLNLRIDLTNIATTQSSRTASVCIAQKGKRAKLSKALSGSGDMVVDSQHEKGLIKHDLPLAIHSFVSEESFAGEGAVEHDGLLGPGNNALAEVVYYITRKKDPTVLVSYGATDILFNGHVASEQRNRYLQFYSTTPSDEALNRAKICLMRELGWTRAAILSSVDRDYARATENLYTLSDITDLDLDKRTFDLNARSIFIEWEKVRVKIFLVILGPHEGRHAICEVYKVARSLLDYSHAWLLPLYFSPTWWQLDDDMIAQLPPYRNCSNADMLEALNEMNLLFLDSLKYNVIPPRSEGDRGEEYHLQTSTSTFIENLVDKTKERNPSAVISKLHLRKSQAAAAYDSVWVLALAHYEVIKQNRTDFLLEDAFYHLNFTGVMKPHSFGSGQDFGASFLVSQFIDGVVKPVRLLSRLPESVEDSCSGFFLSLDGSVMVPGFGGNMSDFVWKGGQLPSDGVTVENSAISMSMFVTSAILILFSLTVCTAALVILFRFRNNRHIKAGDPKFMCVAIISFMTVVPSSIITGLNFSANEYIFSDRLRDGLCILSFPASSFGLIIAYSVFVAKNWKIYRIFHYSIHREISGVSMWFLHGITAGLCLPFICITVVWVAVSHPAGTYWEDEISPSLWRNYTFCKDKYQGRQGIIYWQTFLFLYQALLLLMLLYLSYKNSTIKQALFMEEGQSGARMVMSISVASLLMIIILIFMMKEIVNYLYEFWILAVYTTQFPVFFCAVFFIPKCVAIYKDYRTKEEAKKNNRLLNRITSIHFECDQLKKELEEKEAHILRLRVESTLTNSKQLFGCHQ